MRRAALSMTMLASSAVVLNSSEAEADSAASFPSPTNGKPVYAIRAPAPNHG